MDAIAQKTFNTGAKRVVNDESPSLLTIILDTSPISWHKLKDQLSIRSTLEALTIGINGHLALNNSNCVAIIASHSDGAKFLYPSVSSTSSSTSSSSTTVATTETPTEVSTASSKIETTNTTTLTSDASRSVTPEISKESNKFVNSQMYRQFKIVDEGFIKSIIELINQPIQTSKPKNHLSSSISQALTYINKTQTINPQFKARILVINISEDEHLKYISIMNTIFASQKMRIPIDVCQFDKDSHFLQQASDSTNGVYIKIPKDNYDGLVQYFTTSLFIDPSLRNILIRPTNGDVNFKASCFLTGKVVDVGYVCSVCLCILSLVPDNTKCPACDSEFDNHVIMKLKRKPIVIKPKKKKRKLNDGNGVSSVNVSASNTPTPGVS